jgi:glycosyltransferase involved in cell wall biosynthesis
VNVLLLTSHPVAPPWNSGDTNLARTLIMGDTGVRYTFVGDRIDPTPWPTHHERAPLNFRKALPTAREKSRIIRWLAMHPPQVDLIHAVITFQASTFGQRMLMSLPAVRRRPMLITCPTGEVLPLELLRRARATVVLSRRTERALRQSGVSDVHRIPPGVDLRRFHPEPGSGAAAMLGLDSAPTLLFAGHHDPGGGLDAALEVAGKLRQRIPDLRLLVAMRLRPGEDPGQKGRELRAKAQAAGMGDPGAIVELGAIANIRAAILASHAVLFQPSVLGIKMELPMTLLEALACGRPVAISPLAPLDEISDGSPAVTVADPDQPVVVDHLERLFCDAEYFGDCSAAARELAEDRYGADIMVSRYAELYREIAGTVAARARAAQ